MQRELRIRYPVWSSNGALLALALVFAFSVSAGAVDGVIEINQARALAGGVTELDTPGFPVTISASGSYRLTGDLEVPDENTTAIRIEAADVSVDLNGFTIRGPTNCTGLPPSLVCEPTGMGYGVIAVPGSERVTVRNGRVVGMGAFGVSLGASYSRVEGLTVASNGGWGIFVTSFAQVESNTVSRNGGAGIRVSQSARVTGNVVFGNQGDGIQADIFSFGILAEGNTAQTNGGDGLDLSPYCIAVGNTAYGNRDFGLRLASSCGYRGNVVQSNTGSTISGGVSLGPNACNGSGC